MSLIQKEMAFHQHFSDLFFKRKIIDLNIRKLLGKQKWEDRGGDLTNREEA